MNLIKISFAVVVAFMFTSCATPVARFELISGRPKSIELTTQLVYEKKVFVTQKILRTEVDSGVYTLFREADGFYYYSRSDNSVRRIVSGELALENIGGIALNKTNGKAHVWVLSVLEEDQRMVLPPLGIVIEGKAGDEVLFQLELIDANDVGAFRMIY